MASNLGCIGLPVDGEAGLGRLISQIRDSAATLGVVDGVEVKRWEDASGARLIFAVNRHDEVVDVLPSFADEPGALLTGIQLLNDAAAAASVVAADGEELTQLVIELEQRTLLRTRRLSDAVAASIIALGVDIVVHADADAFAASDASLLDPAGDPGDEPAARFTENGWPWPPRVAAMSFIPYGSFAEPHEAAAYARLAGVVLSASRRSNTISGQPFIAARVRSAGFEATVCYPDDDQPVPSPGAVIAGEVFLVGSLELPPPDDPPASRFSRRRRRERT